MLCFIQASQPNSVPTREKGRSPIPLRLREALKIAGISQKQLGIRAGMDPSVAGVRINQYVTGRHEPSYVIVARLASTLGLPVSFFYTSEDDLAAFVAAYPQLSQKSRRAIKILLAGSKRHPASKPI